MLCSAESKTPAEFPWCGQLLARGSLAWHTFPHFFDTACASADRHADTDTLSSKVSSLSLSLSLSLSYLLPSFVSSALRPRGTHYAHVTLVPLRENSRSQAENGYKERTKGNCVSIATLVLAQQSEHCRNKRVLFCASLASSLKRSNFCTNEEKSNLHWAFDFFSPGRREFHLLRIFTSVLWIPFFSFL